VAVVRKKVVKKKKKPMSMGVTGGAKIEQSPYRPKYVEKRPPCTGKCPSAARVREYLQYIATAEKYNRTIEESMEVAFDIVVETNPIPATTGRVCPHGCEGECNRKDKDEPININACEMFVGDYALEKRLKLKKVSNIGADKRIAVVGGGPSGLSAAYQLARQGFNVTIYEKNEKLGGLLYYGIPNFRLPKKVVESEIQRIIDLGIEVVNNTCVGKDISIDELKSNYDAIYLATGAYKIDKPKLNNIDKIDGIYSGIEFLNKFAKGQKIEICNKVIVIGADTAADAAMVCRRLGSEVVFAYRRTIPDYDSFKKTASREALEAYEEDISFQFATIPVELKEEDGHLKGVYFRKIVVDEIDERGHAKRYHIVEDEDPFFVKADTLIYSVGQKPDLSLFENILKLNNEGFVEHRDLFIDENILVGGDLIGPANMLVTVANSHGILAADKIMFKLTGQNFMKPDDRKIIESKNMYLDFFEKKEQKKRRYRDPVERIEDFSPYLIGLTFDEFLYETKRCMSCGLCFVCENCYLYCTPQAFKKIPDQAPGKPFEIAIGLCDGCKKCAEVCPCGYIDMVL
jgi:NADPH-dependent glutamate synthase beta subunit-like oxidoreductase